MGTRLIYSKYNELNTKSNKMKINVNRVKQVRSPVPVEQAKRSG